MKDSSLFKSIRFQLNGESSQGEVEPLLLLSDFLRDHLGLKGTRKSCEVEICGSSWTAMMRILRPSKRVAIGVYGLAKIRGEAIYTADLSRPGMLHAKIMRSPLPHAVIKKIAPQSESPAHRSSPQYKARW